MLRVVITGASRGIGRAIAVRVARDGAHVIVNYLRNEGAAVATCGLVRKAGGEAWPVQGDVRSPRALRTLADAAVEHLGEVDLLVHNAAMGALRPATSLRVSHWDLTLESSLRPVWLLTKLLVPHLSDGASIVAITSLGSRRHTPGYAAMGAAKAGVEALVRQLSVELAPQVRVNAVCAGLVETDSLQYLPESDRLREVTTAATPLGRVGTPEDVAGAVALLASPDARWITGHTLVVDGGFSAV